MCNALDDASSPVGTVTPTGPLTRAIPLIG